MRRLALAVLLAACGDDVTDAGPDAPTSDAPTGETCDRSLAPADRARFVVVGRPYAADASPSTQFEVLALSETGALTQFSPPRLFSLGGRGAFGTVAFTPNGSVGLVAFDDTGKVGVFTLSADGTPTVVHDAFEASAYASSVVVDPSGERAYLVDTNTRDNGGGIYAVDIACDGTLTDRGMVAAARSPAAMVLHDGRAVIAARDLLDSTTLGSEVHIASLGDPPTRIASGDAFGDDDTVMSTLAVSADGTTAFVGDNNVVGDNRVGIATLTETSVTFAGAVSDIVDPAGIVASPFGNIALVTAAQGAAGQRMFKLERTGTTWTKTPVVTRSSPQIPADVASLTRGALRGHVWVVENVSIRHLRFTAANAIEDLDSLEFGEGLDAIPGVIGVQP